MRNFVTKVLLVSLWYVYIQLSHLTNSQRVQTNWRFNESPKDKLSHRFKVNEKKLTSPYNLEECWKWWCPGGKHSDAHIHTLNLISKYIQTPTIKHFTATQMWKQYRPSLRLFNQCKAPKISSFTTCCLSYTLTRFRHFSWKDFNFQAVKLAASFHTSSCHSQPSCWRA